MTSVITTHVQIQIPHQVPHQLILHKRLDVIDVLEFAIRRNLIQ